MSPKSPSKKMDTVEVLQRLLAYQKKALDQGADSLVFKYITGEMEFLWEVADLVWDDAASKFEQLGFAELLAERDSISSRAEQIEDPLLEWEWIMSYKQVMLSHLRSLDESNVPVPSLWTFCSKASENYMFPLRISVKRGALCLDLSESGKGHEQSKVFSRDRKVHWEDPCLVISPQQDLGMAIKLLKSEIETLEEGKPDIDDVFLDRLHFREMVLDDAIEMGIELGAVPYNSTSQYWKRGKVDAQSADQVPNNLINRRFQRISSHLIVGDKNNLTPKRDRPRNEAALFTLIDSDSIQNGERSISTGAYTQYFTRYFRHTGAKKPKGIEAWTKFCIENYDRFMT